MKYLLDTHTILWYLFGDSRLSQSARKIIESHICFYSYASFWEISIKQSKKKLEFEHTVFEIDEICGTAGFKKLPITEVSALIPRPSCRSLDKLRSARTISI